MPADPLKGFAKELEDLEFAVVDTRRGTARLATLPAFCCSSTCCCGKRK